MTEIWQVIVNLEVDDRKNPWDLLKHLLHERTVAAAKEVTLTVNQVPLENWIIRHLKAPDYAEVKTQVTVTSPMLRFLMGLPDVKQISFPLSTDVQGYLVKQDGSWQLLSNAGTGERYWVYRTFDLLLQLPRKEWLHILRQSAKDAKRYPLAKWMILVGWKD